MRIDALAEGGDVQSVVTWKRVLRAIEKLGATVKDETLSSALTWLNKNKAPLGLIIAVLGMIGGGAFGIGLHLGDKTSTAERSALVAKHETLQERINFYQNEGTRQYQAQISALRAEILSLNERTTRLVVERDQIANERRELENRLSDLDRQRDSAINDKMTLSASYASKIKSLEKSLRSTKKKLSKAQASLSTSRKSENDLKSKITELTSYINKKYELSEEVTIKDGGYIWIIKDHVSIKFDYYYPNKYLIGLKEQLLRKPGTVFYDRYGRLSCRMLLRSVEKRIARLRYDCNFKNP